MACVDLPRGVPPPAPCAHDPLDSLHLCCIPHLRLILRYLCSCTAVPSEWAQEASA